MVELFVFLREKYGIGIAERANNYFKLSWKVVRVKESTSYIKKCQQNDLTPNLSHLNLANNELRRNKNFYKKIQIEVSEEELKFKKQLERKMEKELQTDLQCT